MKRTDASGHVGNRFTSGDVANGVRATEISDTWLNGVQDEIINAIEGDGTTADGADNAQLNKRIDRAATATLLEPEKFGDVTTDATAALNAAFAASAAGQGVVVPLADSYPILSPVTIPAGAECQPRGGKRLKIVNQSATTMTHMVSYSGHGDVTLDLEGKRGVSDALLQITDGAADGTLDLRGTSDHPVNSAHDVIGVEMTGTSAARLLIKARSPVAPGALFHTGWLWIMSMFSLT